MFFSLLATTTSKSHSWYLVTNPTSGNLSRPNLLLNLGKKMILHGQKRNLYMLVTETHVPSYYSSCVFINIIKTYCTSNAKWELSKLLISIFKLTTRFFFQFSDLFSLWCMQRLQSCLHIPNDASGSYALGTPFSEGSMDSLGVVEIESA